MVSGLDSGESVIVQNNGSDDLTVTTDGSFTFSAPVLNGNSYNVTVLTSPVDKDCSVTNGNGTVNGADISNISIACTDTIYSIPTLSEWSMFLLSGLLGLLAILSLRRQYS